MERSRVLRKDEVTPDGPSPAIFRATNPGQGSLRPGIHPGVSCPSHSGPSSCRRCSKWVLGLPTPALRRHRCFRLLGAGLPTPPSSPTAGLPLPAAPNIEPFDSRHSIAPESSRYSERIAGFSAPPSRFHDTPPSDTTRSFGLLGVGLPPPPSVATTGLPTARRAQH